MSSGMKCGSVHASGLGMPSAMVGCLRNAFPSFANVSSKPGCELLAVANDCLMPVITYCQPLAIGGAGVALPV